MTGGARGVRVLGINKRGVLVSNFDVFEVMGEATGKVLLVVHTLTGRDPRWAVSGKKKTIRQVANG